ncbi:hypothetical protein AYI69_g10798, partial [Smittium culicis]
MFLRQYDFELISIKGNVNPIDYLSRFFHNKEDDQDEEFENFYVEKGNSEEYKGFDKVFIEKDKNEYNQQFYVGTMDFEQYGIIKEYLGSFQYPKGLNEEQRSR